jgi:hypothetical protein
MMKYLLAFFLLLSGCSSKIARQNESVRQGVYAVNDSINFKRYDLAKKYSAELTRIVPPPENRIEVSAFSIQTGVDKKGYTVLPEDTNSDEVIIENSEQYKALVEQNKSLSVMISQEVESFNKYRKATDRSLIDMGDALTAEKKKSFWSIIFGILPFAGIGGLIAACIFFPPLLPVITNWLSSIITALSKLLLRQP